MAKPKIPSPASHAELPMPATKSEASPAEQVAEAIVNKGDTLGKAGQVEAALAAFDEVVTLYGERSEAALAEQVASALLHKAILLGNAGQVEAARAICDEVVRRYGERTETALALCVGTALDFKGEALWNAGHTDEAIAIWDDIVRRYGERPEVDLAQGVTDCLCHKGDYLAKAGRTDEAVAAYDEVVHRYSQRPEAATAEHVARALIGKIGLRMQAEYFGKGEEIPLTEPVAADLVNQGADLSDKIEHALAIFDYVVRCYDKHPNATLEGTVARAIYLKGDTLEEVGRAEEAVVFYDEVIRRYGQSSEEAPAEWVASALVSKIFLRMRTPSLGKTEETPLSGPVAQALLVKGEDLLNRRKIKLALAIFDYVLRRCGERRELIMEETAAGALYGKFFALGTIKQIAQARAACDEVVQRFGERSEAVFAEIIAATLSRMRWMLDTAGLTEEAEATNDDLLRRYGEHPDGRIAELVGYELNYKGYRLIQAGHAAAAVAPLIRALRIGSDSGRAAAARFLSETGPAGSQAVPALIGVSSHENAAVRMAAWEAVADVADASAVPSLFARAVKEDSVYRSHLWAESIIKRLRAAARPELLGIVSDTNRSADERLKALDMLVAIGLDYETAVPALIRLFKTEEDNRLRDQAIQLATQGGLPAIADLVDALNDEDNQTIMSASLALAMLADKAERPEKGMLTALRPAVPKLEELHRKYHQHDTLPDAILVHLLALVELLPEADKAVEKLLASEGEKAELWREQFRERRKKRPNRLAHLEPDTPPEKAPPPPEEKIRELFASLPDEPRARLDDIASLFTAIRREAAKELQPAIIALLKEAEPLDYDGKTELCRCINGVLNDNHLAILDPVTHLPATLATHRPRPSSDVSHIRLLDTRHAEDGRRHVLRIQFTPEEGDESPQAAHAPRIAIENLRLISTDQEPARSPARQPEAGRRR